MVFLTAEGSLASSFEWQQLQPLHTSLLEGFARLPRQLLGTDSSIPTVSDVSKNAKNTNDILRMMRELGEKVKKEYNSSADLPEDEIRLRVRHDFYCVTRYTIFKQDGVFTGNMLYLRRHELGLRVIQNL